MADIDNTTAAKLCGAISAAVPEMSFVLVLVDAAGEIAHLSNLAPRLSEHVIKSLAATWSPEQVDNFVVPTDG